MYVIQRSHNDKSPSQLYLILGMRPQVFFLCYIFISVYFSPYFYTSENTIVATHLSMFIAFQYIISFIARIFFPGIMYVC